MRLFSYCIPVDDGAAPNPYYGICTLAICKPVIRRVAEVGDWVAGVGSVNVKGIDYSNKLVYAMKVTRKMSLSEYDEYCSNNLQGKIPDIYASEYSKKVGDCIYDFQADPNGRKRLGVHKLENRKTDLSGQYALMSNHFYYFGDNAVDIPESLISVVKQGQGHKSNANEPIKEAFISWIESLDFTRNELHGMPQILLNFKSNAEKPYSADFVFDIRCSSALKDEELYHTSNTPDE